MKELPRFTRSMIPLASSASSSRENRWYLIAWLQQLRVRICMAALGIWFWYLMQALSHHAHKPLRGAEGLP
jgi:hypothetical protein